MYIACYIDTQKCEFMQMLEYDAPKILDWHTVGVGWLVTFTDFYMTLHINNKRWKLVSGAHRICIFIRHSKPVAVLILSWNLWLLFFLIKTALFKICINWNLFNTQSLDIAIFQIVNESNDLWVKELYLLFWICSYSQ